MSARYPDRASAMSERTEQKTLHQQPFHHHWNGAVSANLHHSAPKSRNGSTASVGSAARVGTRCSVRISELCAVWKRHCHELPTIRPVSERMDHRLNFHARREGLGNPALPRQTGGTAHLDRPLFSLPLAVIDHHEDPAVRIGPLEFLDGTFQDLGFFGVEHGKGVVCNDRNGGHGYRDTGEAERLEFHWRLPLIFTTPYF